MDVIERIHSAKRNIEDLKKRIKDARGILLIISFSPPFTKFLNLSYKAKRQITRRWQAFIIDKRIDVDNLYSLFSVAQRQSLSSSGLLRLAKRRELVGHFGKVYAAHWAGDR